MCSLVLQFLWGGKERLHCGDGDRLTSASANFLRYRDLSFGRVLSAYSAYALLDSFRSSLMRLRVRSWVSCRVVSNVMMVNFVIAHPEGGEGSEHIFVEGIQEGRACLGL